MSFITACTEWIAVARGSKSFLFNLNSDKQITVELPPAPPPVKPSKTLPSADGANNVVQGLQFSPCGKWLSAYSSSKQIVLWDTNELKLISERLMPKAASSMKFTPDSKSLIIVDKAGDAILFSVQDPTSEGSVILGHLSMLLDVVLSFDGKQIITCDRDEKIRASHFPNAYNIISYCLGHKEFVSSLCLLPHDPSVLLSSSGDGTMQMWEFLSGKLLLSYDCSSDAINKLPVDCSLNKPERSDCNAVIVRKIVCFRSHAECSVVCALIYGYQGCLVYSIVGHSIKLSQTLCIDEVIMDMCFTNDGKLLVHSSKSSDVIQGYSLDCNDPPSISISAINSENIRRINATLNSVNNFQVKHADVPQLLKRKFDNVKDYYEQKKARIGEH